jgi:hypothetical protein
MHHPAAECKKKWPAEPRLGTKSRLGIGGMADPATHGVKWWSEGDSNPPGGGL